VYAAQFGLGNGVGVQGDEGFGAVVALAAVVAVVAGVVAVLPRSVVALVSRIPIFAVAVVAVAVAAVVVGVVAVAVAGVVEGGEVVVRIEGVGSGAVRCSGDRHAVQLLLPCYAERLKQNPQLFLISRHSLALPLPIRFLPPPPPLGFLGPPMNAIISVVSFRPLLDSLYHKKMNLII
jgi:hypothetical protein